MSLITTYKLLRAWENGRIQSLWKTFGSIFNKGRCYLNAEHWNWHSQLKVEPKPEVKKPEVADRFSCWVDRRCDRDVLDVEIICDEWEK